MVMSTSPQSRTPSENLEGVEEKFRFLYLEVVGQVEATLEFMENPGQVLYGKITSRDDYIDNLKNIVEDKCFSAIYSGGGLSEREVNAIRAIQIICLNLERIADFCENLTHQMYYLTDPAFLSRFSYRPMFAVIRESMSRIFEVYEKGDLAGALAICRSEFDLDQMYKGQFDRIMSRLESGVETADLVTCLFVFRYLERIGDSLLNIGEALVFAITGEKFKIEQYDALQQTLAKIGFAGCFTEIDFKSIWESRSGCRVGRVSKKVLPFREARGGLYKEGARHKILREKENIERWETISPGLGPRIHSFHEEGDKGALLLECFPGCTLERLILSAEDELLRNALFVLTQTLSAIWHRTRSSERHPAGFIAQLKSRLDSILQVHPDFCCGEKQVGEVRIVSTRELLDRVEVLEAEIEVPFSIYIHGDFNTNNVIYDHEEQQIHFIDLYRSCQGDYVQDVSVFLVSNFRIPVFEQACRKRLNLAIAQVFNFAKHFAAETGDKTFEARLALGLARSFCTSARFELNSEFAGEMRLRAHSLLEKILNHAGRPWDDFRLPQDIIYYRLLSASGCATAEMPALKKLRVES